MIAITRLKKPWLIILGCTILISVVIIAMVIVQLAHNDFEKNQAAKVYDTYISKTALDSQVKAKQTFLQQSSASQPNANTLRENTLTEMINEALIEHYAAQHTIVVTDEDVNNVYKARASASGGEDKLLQNISKLYGLDKTAYLKVLRADLLRDKVQTAINQPLDTWLAAERTAHVIVYK